MLYPNGDIPDASKGSYPRAGMEFARDPTPQEIMRFLSSIEVNLITGCWMWKPTSDKDGYARFWYSGDGTARPITRIRGGKETEIIKRGRNVIASRFSFHVFVSPLEAGMDVHHTCRTRCCVNPDHLEAEGIPDHSVESGRAGWMDVEFIGGPKDRQVRKVRKRAPEHEFSIIDREGAHVYRYDRDLREYQYQGFKVRRSRRSKSPKPASKRAIDVPF